MHDTIIIEALLQSKTTSDNTITLMLDVITATATVPKTMMITCEHQAYAAYFEQMRVHKNTYIITSISPDDNASIHVQWIAVPAMTTQIQTIVSKHRRTTTLQTIANQTAPNVEKPQRQEHAQPPNNEVPQHTPEPQAITREQPQVEPEATTTQLKTSDIVLAALKHNTGKLHQYQTTSTGYKEHGYT